MIACSCDGCSSLRRRRSVGWNPVIPPPLYRPPGYEPMPPAPGCQPAKWVTEDDVRRIIREELERSL